jgi:hypothetical protein
MMMMMIRRKGGDHKEHREAEITVPMIVDFRHELSPIIASGFVNDASGSYASHPQQQQPMHLYKWHHVYCRAKYWHCLLGFSQSVAMSFYLN